MRVNVPKNAWKLLLNKKILILFCILLGSFLGFKIHENNQYKTLTEKEKISTWLKKHNKLASFTPPASNREFWRNIKNKPQKLKPDQTLNIHDNIQKGVIQECFYATGKWLPIVEEDLRIAQKLEIRSDGDGAHPKFVDLSATNWAATLAHAIAMLGDQIDPDIVKGIKAKIKNEVINPFLAEARIHQKSPTTTQRNLYRSQAPWLDAETNWVGVCLANIVYATLIVETDVNKQAEVIKATMDHIENYFNSFDEDGHTRGGMRYWSYGMEHFIPLAERLLHATGGNINLYNHPKMPAMLTFPENWELKNDEETKEKYYPVFGDNSNPEQRQEPIYNIIAKRTLNPPKSNPDEIWGKNTTQYPMTLLWANLASEEFKNIKIPYVAKKKMDYMGKGSETTLSFNNIDPPTLALATKGGHNGEEHNQNDMGSYTLFELDTKIQRWDIVSGDQPNAGYPKNYFGEKRYINPLASSYGHPVPVINDTLQNTGKAARSKIVHYVNDEEKTMVVYDLAEAYDVKNLDNALRLIYWDKNTGSTVVLDKIIGEQPIKLETPVIIPDFEIKLVDNTLMFSSKLQRYKIEIDSSTPSKISMEKIRCISWPEKPIEGRQDDPHRRTFPKEVTRIGIKNHIPQEKSWIWYRISREETLEDKDKKSKQSSPIQITTDNLLTDKPKEESIKTCLKLLEELTSKSLVGQIQDEPLETNKSN